MTYRLALTVFFLPVVHRVACFVVTDVSDKITLSMNIQVLAL